MSDPPGRQLPSASPRESLAFVLRVMLPNLIQGLFRRRPRAVALATRLGVDRRAVRTIERIRRRHGQGPVRLRGGDGMVLALATEDIRTVLEGSPDPFAPDPDAKRRGVSHFQPDALTISRGEAWANRRRFAEAVLDTGRSHQLADRFARVVEEELESLLADPGAGSGQLDWNAFHRSAWRITRRVVLGDRAADDQELTDLLARLMDEANGLPKEGERSELLEPYLAKIAGYVSAAEPGSLVGQIAEAPSDAETKVERQLTHWLFAMGDTLSANVFRALALLASHPRQRERVESELAGMKGGFDAGSISSLAYLEGCLEEAMRLWPTTPLLSRVTLEGASLGGAAVPAGTQVLISNTFNHRDPQRQDADRFDPEAWTEGDRAEDWSLNQFSHGPQGCPGAGLALFLGKAMLAKLMQRGPRLLDPRLDPGRPLPQMLDFFRLRFAVDRGAHHRIAATSGRPTPH